jgi:hypothetical protein
MPPLYTLGALLKTKPAPAKPRVEPACPLDNLLACLHELAASNGKNLADDQQRVLRACLRLAGQPLGLQGLCDLEFFVTFEAFKDERALRGGLNAESIAAVLAAARQAVGATGRFARLRAGWYDAFEAPRVLRELSSVALLIRALRSPSR